MSQLVFFGSDHYSAIVLERLIGTNLPGDSRQVDLEISVVTDPHPGGSPVERLARTHNLPIAYYPTPTMGKNQFVDLLSSWLVDTPPLGLCASFDHLIPVDIIELFRGNLYNLHPSLLPQYRNVSPVQYAIALGDKVTGITLFRISPGIDNGEIIAQAQESILPDDTTTTLTPRLFVKGAELFVEAISNNFLLAGKLENRNTGELVFTRRLKRDSGYIEWSVLHKLLKNQPVLPGQSKNELLNLSLSQGSDRTETHILLDLLRALTPWPTVWSTVPSKKGDLRVILESFHPEIRLKIAGKPKSIFYADFAKYYL